MVDPIPGVAYTRTHGAPNAWVAPGRPSLPASPAIDGEMIAVISSDPAQETALRAELVALGWSVVWHYAAAGKTINGADVNGLRTVDNIAEAREDLTAEPTLWVLDLADTASAAAGSETAAVLAALGTGARQVIWVGDGYPNASASAPVDAARGTVEPLVTAHRNGVYAEWKMYQRCHRDTAWWSGAALTATGRAQKAHWLAKAHILAPHTKPGLNWNPSKLLTYEAAARVGSTYTDIRTVPGFNASDDLKTNLARLTAPSVVYLPEGDWWVHGFQGPWLGGIRLGQAGTEGQTLVKGLRGDGMRDTRIRLRAYSSTDAANVPTADATINPLKFLVFKDIPGLELTNVGFFGSHQGHNYHGVEVQNCPDAVLDGTLFKGAAHGDTAKPPGECMSLQIGQSPYIHILNSEFDGRDDEKGDRVASSMIAYNGPGSSKTNPTAHTQGAHVENVWYHDARIGMATWWLWDSAVTMNYWYDDGGGIAINHEEAGYEDRPFLHYNPSFIIRGFYEGRQPNPLPGINPANRSGGHWTQLSGHHDTKNIRFYFMRPDDATFVRGQTYKRHDRGPSLEIGALGVNNGASYPTGVVGANKSVTPAHVFKAHDGRVSKLAAITYDKTAGLTADTAFIYYR